MPTESRKAIRTAAAWAADQAAMEALYGVGGYYTTLSLWEAGEQRDLTASDEVAVAVCYNDWPSGLSNAVSIGGWTTDATRKIVLTVAEGHRHTGVPKTGFYMKASANFGHVISCTTDTEFEWFDVENTASAGFAFTFPRVIKNTLAKGGPEREAFRSVSSYSVLTNCLAYGGAAGFNCTGYSAPTLLNCVATNCATGFNYSLGGSGYILKNCVGYGNTTDFNGTASASSTTNASSNGTPPGSNPITGVTAAAFVDAAGLDFHLAAGSPLIGAGANLYSDLQIDIDGDARPSTGAWDIGFDHYVTAGPSESVSAEGALAALSLAAPAAMQAVVAPAAGSLASLQLAAPTAAHATDVAQPGALPSLTLVPAQATHAVEATAQGAAPALALVAPQGDASTAADVLAAGELRALALYAPQASATPITIASGALPDATLVAPSATADTTAGVVASGAVAPIALAPPAAAAQVDVPAQGALAGLALTAPQATADSLVVVVAQGDLAPITLVAPSGQPGVDVVGQGAMAGVLLVPPTGQGGDEQSLPPANRIYRVPYALRAYRVRYPARIMRVTT